MIPELSFIIFSLMTEFSEAFQPFRLPISPLNDSIALKYIALSVVESSSTRPDNMLRQS